MITVVCQSTAERKQETKDLFEKVKPYLDKGCSYPQALRAIGSKNNNNRKFAWYRDLLDYGETQGYPKKDYKGW